ncbi:23S rRNA m(2)A-2503 methyltransferase [Geoalkalibacter ferrihydriticus]|uniref:Probable dual-specificity RNA methyltransferase RlmN n=2 Tax=Geoalkalibacter ferrihydriticus TaxID=392333 RepID=A0A0C2HPZ3_9BACT|nr:23S rRNA (adenine(2503)-C(2))-methyltransferase RlmN [Geoalkalibacter ferrihydriticus]KIH76965.1 50S rRNA methyltransferase [Geoalkalibacter ferrihydriticus DSM 17813]SDL42094.1 23S rRNA m(2)A-2503 methyltransferase [Geoalkalibacter ferrihydriticus]
MTEPVVQTDRKVDLKNFDLDALTAFLGGMGKERFRARQIFRWMYRQGVSDFAEMTDLSKDFRRELQARSFVSRLVPEAVESSRDGTRKYLLRLADGQTVESVRIPMDEGRSTLCISTQVGCAMQCRFCLTGTFGLMRNLSVAEIVNQVCAALVDGPVNNIVLMGMGEPLHNLESVITALHIFYAEEGLSFSPRRITLSTCGLVPEMAELGRRIRVNLAVSLNATTDEVRDRLMPVNRSYPLARLMAACRDYPLQPRQSITFEYIVIRGLNDSPADAKRLVRLLHGIRAKVNLIPFNEHEGSDWQAPTSEAMDAFQSYLLQRNIVTIRRSSKGADISAACGQLKGRLDKEQQQNPTGGIF